MTTEAQWRMYINQLQQRAQYDPIINACIQGLIACPEECRIPILIESLLTASSLKMIDQKMLEYRITRYATSIFYKMEESKDG